MLNNGLLILASGGEKLLSRNGWVMANRHEQLFTIVIANVGAPSSGKKSIETAGFSGYLLEHMVILLTQKSLSVTLA